MNESQTDVISDQWSTLGGSSSLGHLHCFCNEAPLQQLRWNDPLLSLIDSDSLWFPLFDAAAGLWLILYDAPLWCVKLFIQGCMDLCHNRSKHSSSVIIHLQCWRRIFTAISHVFNYRRKTKPVCSVCLPHPCAGESFTFWIKSQRKIDVNRSYELVIFKNCYVWVIDGNRIITVPCHYLQRCHCWRGTKILWSCFHKATAAASMFPVSTNTSSDSFCY